MNSLKPRFRLLPDVGLCVVDFSTLYKVKIAPTLGVQLNNLDIKWWQEPTPIAKRLIKHNVILGVCEEVRKANSHGNLKTTVYTNKDELENVVEIACPSVHPYVVRAIWHTLNDIDKKLPILVYFAKYQYTDFVNPLIATGVIKEVKRELSAIADKDYSDFTFEKVRKYTEKEGLKYLNKEYFQSLKSKLIMSI